MTIREGTKIAFMGAGGTGKTTTATTIALQLEVPLMKSASRIVYEDQQLTETLVNEMDSGDKWALQADIFDEKTRQDDGEFSFVADRSLLDHWAYCLMYCAPFMSNEEFFEFELKVRKHMKATYTHLFYFPWGYFEPETDGVRSEIAAWQSSIDALIVGHVLRWNLSVVEVPQLHGPDYRTEFVKARILGLEDPPIPTPAEEQQYIPGEPLSSVPILVEVE